MLKPLGDRVVIRVLEQEEKLQAVFYRTLLKKTEPGRSRSRRSGQSTGTTVKRVAFGCQVGDKIIFSKYAGTEVKFEGTKYLIVSERDILAIC